MGRGMVLGSLGQRLGQRYDIQDRTILRTHENIMRRLERFRLAYHLASLRMNLWLVRTYVLRRLHKLSTEPCHQSEVEIKGVLMTNNNVVLGLF